MVFTNPTLSESAFNADSDSVGFVKTTAVFRSFRLTAVYCGRAIERMAWRRTSSLSAPSPPHSAGLSGLYPHLPHFLAAGIAIIRALKAIQCSVVLSRPQNFKDQESGLPVCGWTLHTTCCPHGGNSFRSPGGSIPPKGIHSCRGSLWPQQKLWLGRALE